MLDKAPWTVVSWNPQGDLELRRGIHDVTQHLEDVDDPELGQFKEGELRQSFVKHRAREWKLRAKKLDEFSRKHGRIFCEVPRCGFDFKTIYGSVGEGFAEVHHLDPLGSSPAGGQISSLDRLSVVCSNCHRMIHRGGECRRLETLLETK
jgi:predicted HNH restriction endonuclease